MLNQNEIDDLITFIKMKNNVFKATGKGYYRVASPCCDNGSTKYQDCHGNIQFKEVRFKCWKCSKSMSLLQYVMSMGYNNQSVIKALKALKQSGYIYNSTKSKTNSIYDIGLKDRIRIEHNLFRQKYPDQYNVFMKYVIERLGDINPIQYGISPLMKDNKLLVNFYNSSGNQVTARYVEENNNMKYFKYKNSSYYYHQSIKDITGYNNITISEGIFDIINLSNYYLDFKKSFFFAINGHQYNNILSYVISKYFLIGKYNFNIVFDDDDIDIIKKTKQDMINTKIKLNKQCTIKFYKPDIETIKDVSNLMTLKEIM
jgi:hypothetical protein